MHLSIVLLLPSKSRPNEMGLKLDDQKKFVCLIFYIAVRDDLCQKLRHFASLLGFITLGLLPVHYLSNYFSFNLHY